jgi:acyl-CoA dehydrogenase
MALPFRDAEDAVGTSSMAGNLAGLVRLIGAELGPQAGEAAVAELGALAGLAALAAPCAEALARAVDEGRWAEQGPQSLLIGLRQLAATFHARAVALRAESAGVGTARVDARLASIQTSLSVARGPRAVRTARLGQAMLGA